MTRAFGFGGLSFLAGLVLAIAAGGLADAQTSMPLRGEAFIAGKTPVDPPPEEPKNSHAYLRVRGPAAAQMYRGMTAKPEKNLCEEGKTMKRAGSLTCSVGANGRDAACDFAVDLRQGQIADGQPC